MCFDAGVLVVFGPASFGRFSSSAGKSSSSCTRRLAATAAAAEGGLSEGLYETTGYPSIHCGGTHRYVVSFRRLGVNVSPSALSRVVHALPPSMARGSGSFWGTFSSQRGGGGTGEAAEAREEAASVGGGQPKCTRLTTKYIGLVLEPSWGELILEDVHSGTHARHDVGWREALGEVTTELDILRQKRADSEAEALPGCLCSRDKAKMVYSFMLSLPGKRSMRSSLLHPQYCIGNDAPETSTVVVACYNFDKNGQRKKAHLAWGRSRGHFHLTSRKSTMREGLPAG